MMPSRAYRFDASPSGWVQLGNRDSRKTFRRRQALGWRRKPLTAPEVQYHRNATHPGQDENSSKEGGESFFLT
jgi:hypothetical protein